MHLNTIFEDFIKSIDSARSLHDLTLALAEATRRMGYDYFALTHHVDWRRLVGGAVRLHNYPPSWVEFFDEGGLAGIDPVQRVSERADFGFHWSAANGQWDERDRYILALAEAHGVGAGYTVPFQMPGELLGSCTFAVRPRRQLPTSNLHLAYAVGRYAFAAARRMAGQPAIYAGPTNRVLTDQQRAVTALVAQGMTNKAGSRVLGISPYTFREHVSDSYVRLGAHNRSSLTLRALLTCSITFSQVIG